MSEQMREAALRQAHALIEQGALTEAEDGLSTALRTLPADPELTYALGVVRLRQDRDEDAVGLFGDVLKATPGHAGAHLNMARALIRSGSPADALPHLQQALDASADNFLVLWLAARAYRELGQRDKVLALAGDLTRLAPKWVEAWLLLGEALLNAGRPDEAVTAYRMARVAAPESVEARINLGVAYQFAGKLGEAAKEFQATAKLVPTEMAPAVNLFSVLWSSGRIDQARRLLGSLLRQAPHDPDVVMAAAISRLATEPDRLAWEAYEARMTTSPLVASVPVVYSDAPHWSGGETGDKRVLVFSEQGFGDVLFFARYLPRLAQRVGAVVVAAPPVLHELLMGIEGVAATHDIRERDMLPEHDAWTMLGSLPLHLGCHRPGDVQAPPYLVVPEERRGFWRERLAGDGERQRRARIGIAWGGGKRHIRDRCRSMPFGTIVELVAAIPAEFYALQVDETVSDGPNNLHDLGSQLNGFGDTAAALSELDLLICVDTAVANLAGAMNLPVWVLLDVGPDWRWGLQGGSTPWYPGARLFRQREVGDWEPVIEEVAAELGEWLDDNDFD